MGAARILVRDDRMMIETAVTDAPLFGVVVVHWNTPDLLISCLDQVLAQSRAADRILVVDNASDQFDEPTLRARFPTVAVLRLPTNRGFAGGANAGSAALADCDWLAFVNPDAFPDDDWLAALHAATIRHPDAASFASLMHKVEPADQLDGSGDIYHISGRVWRRGEACPAGAAPRDDDEVFSACAGAGLYRHDVFMALGGFDERFFCYLEDVDLGFRLRLAGHRCLVVAAARVRHVGSAITVRGSDFSVYHGHRNLIWTFVKNMPGPLLWALLPYHVLLNLGTLVLFSLRGPRRALWRAKVDALRGLPAMWRERRRVQCMRTASYRAIWRVLDKGPPWPRCG